MIPRRRSRPSLRSAEHLYRRTLQLLAVCDQPPKALLAALRSWARWCGAQLIVLAALSADGALADVHSVGRTHTDPRDVAARCLPLSGPASQSLTVEKLRLLTIPLTTANGIDGLLAIGVQAPRIFDTTQRRRLRQLESLASVALQLTALRQRNDAPSARAGDPQRRLNRREREVIDLLIAGQTLKETAATLNISPRTVETYLDRLKQRHHKPRLSALLVHLVKTGLA